MGTVEITLTLPEDVAEQAQKLGLLTSERVTAILVAELERRKHPQTFGEMLDMLHSNEPPFTEEEAMEEIRLHFEEKRAEREHQG